MAKRYAHYGYKPNGEPYQRRPNGYAKSDAPYGWKSDGTPRKYPQKKLSPHKADNTSRPDKPGAPYGFKADGTPRKWPPRGFRVSTGGHGLQFGAAKPLQEPVGDMLSELMGNATMPRTAAAFLSTAKTVVPKDVAVSGVVARAEAAGMDDFEDLLDHKPGVLVIDLRVEYALPDDSNESIIDVVNFAQGLKNKATEEGSVVHCTIRNLPNVLKV